MSGPPPRGAGLVSSQSIVDEVQVGERVALAEELSLRAGRCPNDVAFCLELVRGVARQPEVVEAVALHHLLAVAPHPIQRAECTAVRVVLPRPIGGVVHGILGAHRDLRLVPQGDAAYAGREGPDVSPVRMDVGRVRVVLISGGREDGFARHLLIYGAPLRRPRVLQLNRLQRPRDRALSPPREQVDGARLVVQEQRFDQV